jgi:pilus assembly protein CpaE
MRASTPWIVIDLPHVWTGWSRRMLVAADDVVVVASPDLANLRNAKNLIDNIKNARPQDHPPRLVLNGVGMVKRPEITTAEFAKTVEVDPVAVIPHDAKLFGSAANNGQMIAEVEASGKMAGIFVGLALVVAGRAETRRPKKSLFDPLMAKLTLKRA